MDLQREQMLDLLSDKQSDPMLEKGSEFVSEHALDWMLER